MLSSYGKVPPFGSKRNRYKSYMETHEAYLRNSISQQAVVDPNKVYEEHLRVFQLILKNGYNPEERPDMWELLEERRHHMMEKEEERIWKCQGGIPNEANLCIYLTREWAYVVGYTKNMGHVGFTYGNDKPGFPALLIHNNGNLVWSEEYCNMIKQHNLGEVIQLEYLIRNASLQTRTSSKLTEELFLHLRASFETRMKETVSHILLVRPVYTNQAFSTFLRGCCRNAGFKRISVLTDSSLIAYNIIRNCPVIPQNQPNISVLVIYNDSNFRMNIFGCDVRHSKINGVQLLAAAASRTYSKDHVRTAYKRALEQMSVSTRNTVRFYVLINYENSSKDEKSTDEIFQTEEGLVKCEHHLGEKLKEVFSHFTNNPAKIENFLDTFLSIPIEPPGGGADSLTNVAGTLNPTLIGVVPTSMVVKVLPSMFEKPPAPPLRPNINSKNVVPPSDDAIRVLSNLGSAKLPLKVCTLDGKTYKIIAVTNWTLKRLKKEFLDLRGHQDIGTLVLQYRARMLTDDDALLSSFKMDPDSVIQANFGKANPGPIQEMHDMSSLNIAKKNSAAIYLVGNCLALQNGTEAVDVPGIKRGSLMMALIDIENATVGEVSLTCKINGFGNTVYVGVKFRKQLAIGSSGIQIEHGEVVQGYCDKCKGRKSLFIPRDSIGKGQLFQVQ